MIKAIKTDEDLAIALREIEHLMDIDPDPGTAEAEQLEILTILVQDYERKKIKNLQVR